MSVDVVARGLAVLARTTASAAAKQALRAKLNALPPINVLTQPTYSAPAAWAGSTAYIKGEGTANGGNWYVCNTPGTSAASGGPTGTGTAPITDGTVTWNFFCAARAVVTEGAPTLATATTVPADLVTTINVGGGEYNKRLRYPTSLYFVDGGAGGPVTGSPLPKNASFPIGAAQVEFWTDAPKFSWRAYYCAALRIIVDGVTLTVGDFKTAAPTANSYNTVDFGGVRKPRRVQILGSEGDTALYVTAVDTVWRTAPPLINGLFIGDSWAAGAAPGPNRREDTSVNHFARALGLEGMCNASIGGSGFYTTNGGSVYNYLERMNANPAYMSSANFDFVVIQGSGNDIGTATDPVLQAQMLAVMQRVRQLQPNALILVTEILSTTLPANSNVTGLNALIKAAFSQFGDNNSAFVPISSTTTPEGQAWFDSRNAAALIGNPDAHPFDAGLRYIGGRFAQALRLAVT